MDALAGKRIIVTGGAGGIGGAAVQYFIEQGAKVACTYNATAPELPKGVFSARCDIASKASVDAAIDTLVKELGGLDGLVHAAGVHGFCPAEDLTEEMWDRTFALNAKATLFVNQAAFRHLKATGGSIVNMGSCEGVRGFASNACYAATRGAVMAFTRSVALEWGRYKVRVNALAPVAETRLAQTMRERADDAAKAAMDAYLQSAIPLGGRMGDPYRDIAPILAFLMSDSSHFMTGQTVPADGGFMMLGS